MSTTAPAPIARPRRLRKTLAIAGTVIAMATTSLIAVPAATAAPAPSAGVVTTTLKPARQILFDQQMIAYVNQTRVNAGLQPLKSVTGLARTASYWTVQMINGKTGGTLAHNPALGPMVLSNLKTTIVTWGENVAAFTGGYTARDIFTQYMASPGHRANILNPRYRYIGTVTVAGGAPLAFNTMNFAG